MKNASASRASFDLWMAIYMTSMVLRRVSSVTSNEEGDVQEHLVLVFECSKDTEQPQRPENRETEEDRLRGISLGIGFTGQGERTVSSWRATSI